MAYHQNYEPKGYQQQYPPNYPPQHPDDGRANWDAKSIQSYQSHGGGSQAHLVPYESDQYAPPVPYQQPNYPPSPNMYNNNVQNGYHVMREKMMRRRSVRQVALVQGNLVLDVIVPSNIVPQGKQDVEEMTKMRYTAATCDPDDFMSSRYSLRPYLMGRKTELFIVMTMYNEDEVLFVKTMNA